MFVCLGVFYNDIRDGNSRLVDKRGLSFLHVCLGVFYNLLAMEIIITYIKISC
jgi:hypothetical protein